MKKVMRSPILKGIAFVVCLVCVAVAGLTLGNATQWFYEKSLEGGGFPYEMDASFDESDILNRQFSSALSILDDALHSTDLQQYVDQQMEASFAGDYYAKLGDVVLKNTDLTREEAEKSPYYVVMEPGSHYNNLQNFVSYQYETWDQATYNYYINGAAMSSEQTYQQGDCILLRLTEEQAAVLRAEWEEGRDIFNGALTKSIAVFFIALIAFIYLLFVTGRRPEDEEVHLVLIDRMFVELNLCIIGGTVIGTAALVLIGLEAVFFSNNQIIVVMTKLLTALLVCAFALVMELLLSLVRNLKNRTFVERSFILRAVRWCWRTVRHICRWFMNLCKGIWHGVGRGKDGLWHKAFQNYKTRKVLIVFGVYSAVLAFCGVMLGVMIDFGWGTPFMLGIGWFAAAAWLLIRRIDGFDCVVDALRRLRGGDLTYKLTDMPEGVFASMADDINSLGDGMQIALQNEVRAERMKSELITNVSHDLKTPLTSILNYSDLLCQEHLTPEEANDYAKIIHQKGMRLKNLTSDLFDISKVQSGAERIFCERLDACTLVRQALGEQDQSIGDGKLTLKVDLPEHEVPIWADGKKMSRVMENLIGNCIKYAMPGTRVFVSVMEQEGNAVIELKNIANYAMDFDASEITERFVRGDAARSTEGSGLGLAIAKSYVEACGGAFAVSVDGDLFKVQITFAIQP
ncbi:HAMP domain-containing sensor histidine kinase [uncultured Agathobaculum sp.]|uniref:sensor histidine kinase n=1 Tax=uncultured Agathobaculum sp. TaxID=2048140 RepID=UPI00320A9456